VIGTIFQALPTQTDTTTVAFIYKIFKKIQNMLTFPCILFAPLKACFIKPQTPNTFCIHIENDV
jgi:hypothetical protein